MISDKLFGGHRSPVALGLYLMIAIVCTAASVLMIAGLMQPTAAGIMVAIVDNPGASDYARKQWPSPVKPGKFSPRHLMPELDAMGKQGWELVSLQPVVITSDAAIVVVGSEPKISNSYLVALKRQIR